MNNKQYIQEYFERKKAQEIYMNTILEGIKEKCKKRLSDKAEFYMTTEGMFVIHVQGIGKMPLHLEEIIALKDHLNDVFGDSDIIQKERENK